MADWISIFLNNRLHIVVYGNAALQVNFTLAVLAAIGFPVTLFLGGCP